MKKNLLLLLLSIIFCLKIKAESLPVSGFLKPDGTLNMLAIKGKNLSFDLKGRHIRFDLHKGPVFDLSNSEPVAEEIIYAICVHNDVVYVGGNFKVGAATDAGLNNIAKWDGQNWSPLDMGLDDMVLSMAMIDNDLYVGGNFKAVAAGGTPVMGLNHIAKWNGEAWKALDKGLDNSVAALAASGNSLYVGGEFTNVGEGGKNVAGLNKIAKWSGTAWSALNKGLNGDVHALAVSANNVYVGGEFTAVGLEGYAVEGLNNIAKWNGKAWMALDKGLDYDVLSIAVKDGDVYVGGLFTGVGPKGVSVKNLNKIAKWNGEAWSALDKGLNNAVTSIAIQGNTLYVGGDFNGVGKSNTAVKGFNKIAIWDGKTWAASPLAVSKTVWAAAISEKGLYVGGEFVHVGKQGSALTGIKGIAFHQLTQSEMTETPQKTKIEEPKITPTPAPTNDNSVTSKPEPKETKEENASIPTQTGVVPIKKTEENTTLPKTEVATPSKVEKAPQKKAETIPVPATEMSSPSTPKPSEEKITKVEKPKEEKVTKTEEPIVEPALDNTGIKQRHNVIKTNLFYPLSMGVERHIISNISLVLNGFYFPGISTGDPNGKFAYLELTNPSTGFSAEARYYTSKTKAHLNGFFLGGFYSVRNADVLIHRVGSDSGQEYDAKISIPTGIGILGVMIGKQKIRTKGFTTDFSFGLGYFEAFGIPEISSDAKAPFDKISPFTKYTKGIAPRMTFSLGYAF